MGLRSGLYWLGVVANTFSDVERLGGIYEFEVVVLMWSVQMEK
jgi:hypothetical protein